MKNKKTLVRLDEYLVAKQIVPDLDTAKRIIMAGKVKTKYGEVLDKPGIIINLNKIEIICQPIEKWVSRGGNKLEHAIQNFSINVNQLKCLDIGASTGGFTDVLLSYGARNVTAVDVGYGVIHPKLRNNPKVKVLERINFRTIPEDMLEKDYDLITIDVSFISLKLIIPKAVKFIKSNGMIIALIKPQFEAPYELVERGGKVIDPKTHISVISDLKESLLRNGVFLLKLCAAPIIYKNKNIEYLSLWSKSQNLNNEHFPITEDDIENEVRKAFHKFEIINTQQENV